MPQLEDPWIISQAFWVLVSFGLMFFFMKFFILPPITKVMDDRDNSIQNDIKIAENLKKELEEAISAYESSMKEAHQKAGEILKQANKEIQDTAKKEDEALAVRMKQRTDEAKLKIASAKEKVLAEVEGLATSLAGNVIEKLVFETVSDDVLRNQVSKEMKDIQ